MEDECLSDADTDELLGISGIQPFGSGASIYVTPTKSPPGSPSDLLSTSPKRQSRISQNRQLSPEARSKRIRSNDRNISCTTDATNPQKSSPDSKRVHRKFLDSPGKLSLGDLNGKNNDFVIKRSVSWEGSGEARRNIADRAITNDLRLIDDKENIVQLSDGGNAPREINSAPSSSSKVDFEIRVAGKSLSSSPYRVENVVVTSHRQNSPRSVSWSDPGATKIILKSTDPILTYKRKLFQDDFADDSGTQIENVSERSEKTAKQGVRNKVNKKVSPSKSPEEAGVVHSGSPTQQTHSASKFKYKKSPGISPTKDMRRTASVSPGRRLGPVTIRQSPGKDDGRVKRENTAEKLTKLSKEKLLAHEKRFAGQKYTHNILHTQYSPDKYTDIVNANTYKVVNSLEKSPVEFSNPLDDVLSQYPLSPENGEIELPDSPGMRAAAETVMTPSGSSYRELPEEAYVDVTSFDIEEMEGARSSLRSMLRMPKERWTKMTNGSVFQDEDKTQLNDSFEEVATKVLMGSSAEVDYEQAIQLTSQLLGREDDSRNMSISQLERENQVLLDTFEREKFRRHHCEKQIGNLQSRLLETQEQLAVAISTEKKKDIMIEQLDKTLSRVVEGWKKREAEKKECIQNLMVEKETFESRYQTQRVLLEEFEDRLKKAGEGLDNEQRRYAELEKTRLAKLEQHEQERTQWATAVENERCEREKAEKERDRAKDGLEHVQAQLDNIEMTLKEERKNWAEEEEKFKKKIQNMTKDYEETIKREKERVSDQTQLTEETRDHLSRVSIELQSTRLELETAMRERDNLKMEMSLLEARTESSKRQLEADLTSEFEKALSEKMTEAHERLVKTETELREGHRKQIQEMNKSQSDDLDELRTSMTDEFKKKETSLKEQLREIEERFEAAQEEVRDLKANKHKMELQRIEMANRMQGMMQSHCNEALSVINGSSRMSQRSYECESMLSDVPSVVDQSKTSRPSNVLQPLPDVYDEGARVTPKVPVDAAVVITRPNTSRYEDGTISDILSTDGEMTHPTYTMSMPVPYPPKPPMNDYGNLQTHRSISSFSETQSSVYPYSVNSHPYAQNSTTHPYIPNSTYQGTNYSHYQPVFDPHAYNGQITPTYTSAGVPSSFSNPPYPHTAPSYRPVHDITGRNITYQPPMPVNYTNQQVDTNRAVKRQFTEPYVSKFSYPPVKNLNGAYEVSKQDQFHQNTSTFSERSVPSMSSGYSSMINQSSHSESTRNQLGQLEESRLLPTKEESDVVNLLNGSNTTHDSMGDISLRMDQHNQRQQELEHYVRVLLGKEPGKPDEGEMSSQKAQLAHSPPQKLMPDNEVNGRVDESFSSSVSKQSKRDQRLVSTAHAPKYGSVMGLAREKLHSRKKGQQEQSAERKSSVRKSPRDGLVTKSSASKPWR